MSEPPHHALSDWVDGDFPHSYLDLGLFNADMDLSGRGYLADLPQVYMTQPIVYEQDYNPHGLSQYSTAFVRPSDDYMLQSEIVRHDQNITDTTWPNSVGEFSTEGSHIYDAKIVNVSTTDAMSRDNKHARESEYICAACGDSFADYFDLFCHIKNNRHASYKCETAGCNRTFTDRQERDAHQKRPHLSDHGRIVTATSYDCAQCHDSFQSKANLLRHGKESQHHPYACECGAFFSRLDVLNRHLESFGTDSPQYPCKYCKRHRGADGFRRKDHLMQHIRNYHHHEVDEVAPGEAPASKSRLKFVFPVCSHEDCPQYRDEAFKQLPRAIQNAYKPFTSLSAYTKHMREEHNECVFPCDILGCDRIGRRGYFREKDLLKHRNKAHPDEPPYQVTKRELRHRCTDCGKDLDPSSLGSHSCYWPF